MKVDICHPRELDEDHIVRWRGWQKGNLGWCTPFLSPGFARAMGEVRDDTRVAVVGNGSEVGAYFAFHAPGRATGLALGLGVSDHQGVVRDAKFEYDPGELARACGLGVWEFDHIGTANPELTEFVEAWGAGSLMDISGGYDSYLDKAELRSTKFYKSSLVKQRKLAAEHGELRFDLDTRDEAAFEALLEWKSQQYKRTGRMDRFGVPWIRSLMTALHFSDSEDCRGMLSVLRAGDSRIVAVHFGIRNATDVAMWFPAYDRDLFKYSPGSMFHLRLAQAAIDAGLQRLDLGKGDEPYKAELKTEEYPVGEGALMLRSPAAVASWVRRVPKRTATDFVLRHDRLRQVARKSLNVLGSLRS